MESLSNSKSLTKINSSESSNDLLIAGYNSLLLSANNRVERDFSLLLIIYVDYFCISVLHFFLKGLRGFGNSDFSKRSNVVYMPVVFFVEDKEYISSLSFLKKEQLGFSGLSRSSYRKTVLQ
ncbi:hypothetical protein [Candidatus Scalindua japonica]|uniref:hypothetical protein n=1 Tax=Candidatus Scalindua japonica TaxID=1284222 RepID=UPI001056581C|nr:hypothetical protein [Candidatus Scalindua japonica]